MDKCTIVVAASEAKRLLETGECDAMCATKEHTEGGMGSMKPVSVVSAEKYYQRTSRARDEDTERLKTTRGDKT